MILHRIKQESGLVSLHEEENLVIMLKVWFGSKLFGSKIIDLLLPKIASISIKVLINHYLKFYKISAWQVSWRFITQETNLQMFKSFLRLMKSSTLTIITIPIVTKNVYYIFCRSWCRYFLNYLCQKYCLMIWSSCSRAILFILGVYRLALCGM